MANLIRPSFVFFFHPDYTGHQGPDIETRQAIKKALEERFHAALKDVTGSVGGRVKNVQSHLCGQGQPHHHNGEIYIFLPEKRVSLELVMLVQRLMWESLTTKPLIVAGEPVRFYGCGFRDVPDDITS